MVTVISYWTATSSMAVQQGHGTQAATGSLTREKASALTRWFLQLPSFAVFACLNDMVLWNTDSLQLIFNPGLSHWQVTQKNSPT